MITPLLRPSARLLALGALLAAPAAAHADPATVVDPGGTGASVTISDTTLIPGQRVTLTGTGFLGTQPAGPGGTEPPGGVPVVAIKPYDLDVGWAWGGPSAFAGTSDAEIWFKAGPVNGEWSGYVDVPRTATPTGAPATADGHWFRILSGAFSSTGGPFIGNVSSAITYRVPFSIVDQVTLGATQGTAFQAGRTFRPNGQVTPRGTDFAPNSPITATLDGAALPVNTITGPPNAPVVGAASTNADGVFPAATRVVVPAGTAPGVHQLAFTVDGETVSYAITVTPLPTATLLTPKVRPGGRLAVSATGFVGVAGKGQKVAVVVDEVVLACLTAKDDGSLTGSALVPAGRAEGPMLVGFNAGLSCRPGGPTAVADDLPGTRVTQTATVAATAPTLTAAASAPAGKALTVSGDGFSGAGPLSASVDGAAVETSLTGGAAFSGTVKLPASTPAGERLLLVRSGDETAAAVFTATAVEPDPMPTPTPAPITPPAPTPAPAPAPRPAVTAPKPPTPGAVKRKGNTITITLTGTAVKGTKVTVKSSKKVRTTAKGKARTVTLAKLTTSRAGKVTLKLTADGKRVLRRYASLKVVVSVTVPGTKTAAKKTVTFRP